MFSWDILESFRIHVFFIRTSKFSLRLDVPILVPNFSLKCLFALLKFDDLNFYNIINKHRKLLWMMANLFIMYIFVLLQTLYFYIFKNFGLLSFFLCLIYIDNRADQIRQTFTFFFFLAFL